MSKVSTIAFDKSFKRDVQTYFMEEMMKAQKTNTQQSEVLFQKLGATWYVFSESGNDMVYSALPDGMDPRTTKVELLEVVEEHMKKVRNHGRNRKAEVTA